MDSANVIQQHKRLCSLVSEKKVKQSLDILADMIAGASSVDFQNEYENIVMTYRSMLTYTIEGVNDPERNKIYLKLIQSILGLSDRVRQDILSHYSGWNTYWVKQQTEKEMKLSGKTIVETVDDLMFKSELDEWLKLSNEINPDPESEISKKHKQLIKNIFNHLWLTDYYGEAENSLIEIILKSGKFRWYEASIFTSAITLSSFRTWQSEKLLRLIDLYNEGQEQVMERALSGLILNLHYYNQRLLLYPEITGQIIKMSQDNRFREHCRIIILQIIRSRETEKLGRKLHDEILPQVAKLKPRIEEKLDLDNILPKEKIEEKNPDWSEVFNGSEEIFKTMEELTKLQMEGADVYMTAFANMKHFDFFKDFQNWFVPFYPDHEAVDEIYNDEILGPGTNELAEALYKTPFICNSDKYSLLLNLKYLPSAQKSMMLKVFRMELDGLQQMDDDKSDIDPYRSFRTIVTQYLQDIYRFYKLSPYKKEFEDLFIGRLDIYNSEFFKMTCNASEAEAGLADYFFSKDFYDDALPLFLKQINEKPSDVQLYEKIGYCYQKNSDYEAALRYYRRAELIDRKAWTLKKIGLCLRRLGKTEEALEYYLQACDMEQENIHTVIMTAHCYLDLKNYELALKYYFRVEYNEPGNIKILRPIAYCYFALGRFDDSEKYYDRLSAGKLNGHDLVNKGHLALCKGNKKEAIDLYRQSINSGDLTKEQFMGIFSEDRAILISLGVNPDDLPILLDYLLFSIS
ncbi:MAG TPA: tetratricopeptide repeat protein [Bacteroidales bacterium]|nr:tetratricopeptide repeat protein [Bacteroidales bacterium]HPT22037.1 tetratricopeptide repeat protein [Bacteroidales bacterium]